MKHLLILALLFNSAFAQNRIEKDTLFFNGAKLVKGQSLHFGEGSNTATRGFNFISTNLSAFALPEKLGSDWNNRKMKIKGFKYQGTKKVGFKYFVILGGGNIVNYMCDLEPAIASKEVIIEGITEPGNTTKSTGSVADELKKMKELLDAGAITQEEYDAQKKKLLN